MKQQIYIDGELVPEDEAKVSVLDHGFLYGDGVFEGIRAYNGRVFKLEEHIDRLYESAKTLMLDIPLAKDEFIEAILKTLRANRLEDAYIRPVVSRGRGTLGLDPTKCPTPSVIIIASSISLYPEEYYQKGLKVATAATRRNLPDALNPRLKSLNYLNNILAKIEAIRLGVPEAIMLNSQGYVAECTGDNIFMIENKELITPPDHAGILRGITRDTVLELASEMSIPVTEKLFTLHDLYSADEIFLTGTAAEVIPVVEIDQRLIADGQPGAITQKLITAFRDYAENHGTPIYN